MYLNVVNYLNNMDKNSRFLLIIIGIISFLLILIYIINFFTGREVKKMEKIRRANKKKLLKEINKKAKEIEATPKTIEPKKSSPAVEEISIKKEEPEVSEVIEVMDEPEEEIIEVLQEDNGNDIDRILNDIKKASKEDSINLNEFEQEQEETAIISYDELCKRAGVKKKVYKAVTEETMDVSKIVPEIKETKKYKPSRYVSPIYGVEKEQTEEDMDKTFLQSLKEFRNTLDM
ncbi:MAG: hypothetical protein J5970_04805 [Bacilli bacterium]|nr:hypothetical protein [Bacilli bacterium]